MLSHHLRVASVARQRAQAVDFVAGVVEPAVLALLAVVIGAQTL